MLLLKRFANFAGHYLPSWRDRHRIKPEEGATQINHGIFKAYDWALNKLVQKAGASLRPIEIATVPHQQRDAFRSITDLLESQTERTSTGLEYGTGQGISSRHLISQVIPQQGTYVHQSSQPARAFYQRRTATARKICSP